MARQIESILDLSAVYLFGRIVDELAIKRPAANTGGPPRFGANNFLREQMEAPGAEIYLARIYAFSFEASFFDLMHPTIYLVHGLGMDVEENPEFPGLEVIARSPPSPSKTGLGSQIGSFARSLKVWAYDKSDFTLRLDLATGTFEQTLLAPESGYSDPLSLGSGGRSSGGRSSGGRSSGGRSSGVMGRSSGWMGGRGDAD